MSSLLLLGLLIIGGSVVASVVGLLLVHRIPHARRLIGENEVAGFLYAVVGVLYGILVAFVVFAVWARYDSVSQAVAAEAADLETVFRDTQFFPAHLQAPVQSYLRVYANEVMTHEWPTHGELLPHAGPDVLNPIWHVYRQVNPQTAWEIARQQNAYEHLYTLERQRHLRHLSGESTLPSVFWAVLIFGGVVTIAFSYFFHVERFHVQITMTGLLGGLVASVLYLIVALNDPFTGPAPVSTHPFVHVLAHFNSLNTQPP